MPIPTPSTQPLPPGAIDRFAGEPLYPIPECPTGCQWGIPLSVGHIPLLSTMCHALLLIEGRWFIARRDVGGLILHAGLTPAGWIQPNGTRFAGSPTLVAAAFTLVNAKCSNDPWDKDCRIWQAAFTAFMDANAAICGREVSRG